MSEKTTYEDAAQQMSMLTEVLGMAQGFLRGDIDFVGRKLGRAIDAYPEFEAALLMAAWSAIGTMLENGSVADEAEVAKAEQLREALNRRSAKLLTLGVK